MVSATILTVFWISERAILNHLVTTPDSVIHSGKVPFSCGLHHGLFARGHRATLPDRFELPFSGPKPDMIDRYIMGVKLLSLSGNIGGDIISHR